MEIFKLEQSLLIASIIMSAYLVAFVIILVARRITRFIKIRDAREYVKRYGETDLLYARSVLSDDFEKDLPSIIARDNPHFASQQQQILQLLNFYEELAISVDMNVVDEEFLRRFFGRSVASIYHRADKLIRHLRASSDNPNVFKQLERLVGRWEFSGTENDPTR